MVDEVYKPIRIGPGGQTTKRTSDNNWFGLPIRDHGLWWIQDDIAKTGDLLQNNGQANGKQILDPDLVAAALHKDESDRGARIDDPRWDQYNNGYYGARFGRDEGFSCEFWASEMRDGGIEVIIMPNGTTYYYFTDSLEETWNAAVVESDKIIPFCS